MTDTGTDFALWLVDQELVRLPTDTSPANPSLPVVYANARPSEPDSVVACSEYTTGEPPTRNMGNSTPIQLVSTGLQLLVRGAPSEDFDVVYARIVSLWRLIGELPCDCVINGVTYTSVEPVDTPMLMSKDDSDRFMLVANFTTTKEPT